MRERLVAHFVAAAAVLCGAGGLLLFGAMARVSRPPESTGWPLAGVLAWDAFLSMLFFVQHSGMVRRSFQNRLALVIAPNYHRALYAVASGVALGAAALCWQRSGVDVLTIEGPVRWVVRSLAVPAVFLFVWGARSVHAIDIFGTRAIRERMCGSVEQAEFIVRGPYRYVRHPWYLGVILLLWSEPNLTADRLLFNLLWTAWVIVGTHLEERDLAHEFGAEYEAYRRRVPMLVPLPRPEL